ncbi:hypothetical protein [Phyllobacterium sp. P5_D12]
MNRTFEQQPDRILIVDVIRENRARRAAWCFHMAIAVGCLAFFLGYLGKVL